MDPLFVVVLIAVAAIAILGGAAKAKKGRLGVDVYRTQESLFSVAELSFLAALDQSIAPGHRVLGKVRLADLVAIKSGLNPKVRQIAINRVAQKHIDFVICSGLSLVPVCAIELNDASHGSDAARRRDDFVSSVCAQVGLPLVVIRAARSYSPETLRQQIILATQSVVAQR